MGLPPSRGRKSRSEFNQGFDVLEDISCEELKALAQRRVNARLLLEVTSPCVHRLYELYEGSEHERGSVGAVGTNRQLDISQLPVHRAHRLAPPTALFQGQRPHSTFKKSAEWIHTNLACGKSHCIVLMMSNPRYMQSCVFY